MASFFWLNSGFQNLALRYSKWEFIYNFTDSLDNLPLFTAQKTIFSFSRRPEKMVFPKRSRWNMIFFFFPKIWSYTLGGKWKMNFLYKIHGNMIFSSAPPKRRSFQKEPRRDMIFLVLFENMVSFSRKHDIFSLGRKPGMTFLKEYMEIWYFLCTRVSVTNVVSRPSAKKNHGWSYPAKIHLKVIYVLDWRPGKGSSNSLYFHGDLNGRFMYCSPAKKKRKLNI